MTALPEDWYASPDIWIAERRAIFERSWQVVARSNDLPEPGSSVATAIGGLGVFVLRQEDARVAGFRNLCRHQGMPVLAAGAGRCSRLRCPYHGWTYNLDGSFAEAPPLVAPEAGADTSLRRIGAGEQDGFVLLHFDPRAEAEPCPALAGCKPADNPMCAETEAGNWKRVMERLLLSPDLVTWTWPNLVVHADAVLVAQPKGFARTELLRLPVAHTGLPAARDAAEVFHARLRALHAPA